MLALVMVGLGDVLLRGSHLPPLASPWRDLSLLGAFGAAAGALLGAVRCLPRLGGLAPFPLVFGAAVGLRVWLGLLQSGGGLLGARALPEAARGAALVAGGALVVFLLLRRGLPPALAGFRARPALDATLVALAILPAAISAFPRAGSAAASGRPNLLVITVDTLRSDRLGLAGHPERTSPHLDRLSRRGVAHWRAVTPQPRTLPGIASLMTGREPPGHGVRDNFHYALGPAAVTLAERLREAGWVTGAVNSSPVLAHDSGICQGFDSASDRGDDWARLPIVRGVDHLATLVAMRRGDRESIVTDLALSWLRTRPRGGPFFLWVHYLAPHMPYEPVPPFDRLFDPAYEGPYARAIDYGDISKGDMTYRNPLPERTVRHVKALYDGEVATTDRAIGRLLEAMDLAGDLDRTLVLVTADHGESLDEHGYFFNHGDFVYGPATNIPLVWTTPGMAPGVSDAAPSLADLTALLLDEAGLDRPEDIDGRWPVPDGAALFGESDFCRFPDLNDRLGYLLPLDVAQNPDRVTDWKERWEAQANRAKQRFVEVGPWKLVWTPRPDGDRAELFDLRADPAETVDRSAAEPAVTAELTAAVRAWIQASASKEGTARSRVIDDALREQMQGLGYLGR